MYTEYSTSLLGDLQKERAKTDDIEVHKSTLIEKGAQIIEEMVLQQPKGSQVEDGSHSKVQKGQVSGVPSRKHLGVQNQDKQAKPLKEQLLEAHD